MLLDDLEELLSITERFKHLMTVHERNRWQAISAECADKRSEAEGEEVENIP